MFGERFVAILSRPPAKDEAGGDAQVLASIAPPSLAAWRHIAPNGHDTFRSDGETIDLHALAAGVELG